MIHGGGYSYGQQNRNPVVSELINIGRRPFCWVWHRYKFWFAFLMLYVTFDVFVFKESIRTKLKFLLIGNSLLY